ncbi:WecB/TagA/CpsF family glycosyltransferase [Consotaella aegiceratis]|uniref:WecB/TagA/CpsF family glycosyltransferase n=1 Tax=Consotaella aegiceratis TaxID=3097961 RepID=UPI002F42E117
MAYTLPIETQVEALPNAAVRDIGGVDVIAARTPDVIALLEANLAAGRFTRIGFLNAHCSNIAFERPAYRRCLQDFIVLPDGIGVDIASRILFGERFPENLNGTDLTPAVLGGIGRPLRVALLGAEPGIVEAAARNLGGEFPQHRFLAVSHGYFGVGDETAAVLEKLRQARADLVLVGLGVPRQEFFVATRITAGEGCVVMAIGAFLDFAAGKVPRAPIWMRRSRLEWAYRLWIEPKRLWRRYVVGNPVFLFRILLLKLHGRKPKA